MTAPWKDEVAEIHTKLDAILEKVDGHPPLEYKLGWPTEPMRHYYVRDQRVENFVDLVMRSEYLGPKEDNVIVVRYGGQVSRKEDRENHWEFAGPITQVPVVEAAPHPNE